VCDGKIIMKDEQILKEMVMAYLKVAIPESMWRI
jgi:hypothetical protein